MQAKDEPLLTFLASTFQMVAPPFQRRYDWDVPQCEILWEDILRAGRIGATHYLGVITLISPDSAGRGSRRPAEIVDGQQRLATTSLLLAAIAAYVDDDHAPEDYKAEKIRAYFLCNVVETCPERRYKLHLTEHDHDTLLALLHDEPLPVDPSPLLVQNFAWFERQLRRLSPADLQALFRGLELLVIVLIGLVEGIDDPQRAFESLNARGRPLTPCDLVRNFMLMDLSPALRDRIYSHYLRPMEKLFGAHYERQFPVFVRSFLMLRTGDSPAPKLIYDAFKGFAHSPRVQKAGREALARELLTYSGYFCAIACDREADPELRNAFRRLAVLKAHPAYPFLLRLYHEWAHKRLSKADLAAIVRLIESYLVRRSVCGLPASSHVHIFIRMARALRFRRLRHAEDVEAEFLLLSEPSRFPDDAEFGRALIHEPLYNAYCAQHVLECIENQSRKELLPRGTYTIEHVLPQRRDLSREWKRDLGPDYRQVQQTWVHTLGNLSLSAYNSELRDHPFATKQSMSGGYSQSPLFLASDLKDAPVWNEEQIRRRAEGLAPLALADFPFPALPDATLQEIRARTRKTWTLADHPNLLEGAPMHALFEELCEQLRRQGLSPTSLRYYVAFKSRSRQRRTNILDVEALRDRMRCYLNTSIDRLHDRLGLATDVRGKEHRGNGDVLVELHNEAQLHGLIELVRQVLDAQQASDDPGESA